MTVLTFNTKKMFHCWLEEYSDVSDGYLFQWNIFVWETHWIGKLVDFQAK